MMLMKPIWRRRLSSLFWIFVSGSWINFWYQHPPVATMTENQRILFSGLSWISLAVLIKLLQLLIRKIRQN